MLKFEIGSSRKRLRVMCLGAHGDDLEIGCAGTLLQWLANYPKVEVTWVVLSAVGPRAVEARRSAKALLRDASRTKIVLRDFRDGYFPSQFVEVKKLFEELKASETPDLILTHRLEDRHQDHRQVAELTWQTWRDHLILEYEIPKYEGDLGQPNLYVPLATDVANRKVRHLLRHFGTQRSKGWFSDETFLGLMRLRGIECRAPSGMAEGFHARKAII
jgi:LmbE family N-acetylglucosaminyl deacetylase